MKFEEWITEREFILSELELLGRLVDQGILLEVDATQGAAGAVYQVQSVLQSSLVKIEDQAETAIFQLKDKLKTSENPNIELSSYIKQKKFELNKIRQENTKDSQWLNGQNSFITKGLGFLVKLLKSTFIKLLTPIIRRLQKAFWDGLNTMNPKGNMGNIILTAIALTLFVSMSTILVSFTAGGSMMAPIASLVIFIYFKAANGFMTSLVEG
jgi:hypothetical protein